jgi:hypothetical protein
MSFFEKLKKRWHIESNIQIVLILIVFAITGFSAVYAKEFIFEWLGVDPEWPFWVRALIWLVTILPTYNVLLLFYGTVFGQQAFFWGFVKKSVGRLFNGRKKEINSDS